MIREKDEDGRWREYMRETEREREQEPGKLQEKCILRVNFLPSGIVLLGKNSHLRDSMSA